MISLTALPPAGTDLPFGMNDSGAGSFIWIVLGDGRSIFARCDGVSRQSLIRVLSRPDLIIRLQTDGEPHHLRVADVAAYTFFETAFTLPAREGIYEFAGL